MALPVWLGCGRTGKEHWIYLKKISINKKISIHRIQPFMEGILSIFILSLFSKLSFFPEVLGIKPILNYAKRSPTTEL